MAVTCNKKHPLIHNGTSQDQRFLQALEPGSVKIHDFTLREWMRFAWHYAAHLKYYDLSNDKVPEGNWQVFMQSESEIETFLKDAALAADETWMDAREREKLLQRSPRGDYQPHLALFLSFLKLMKYPQDHLNDFSRRHLDFYYSSVLKLSKKPAVPDRTHILFELAKNATEEVIGKNAVLLAGKDKNNKSLKYHSLDEIIVNKSKIEAIKSILHLEGKSVKFAEKSNSADGLGTPFTVANSAWQPFGDDSWPGATLGFALASNVLLMKEGTRTAEIILSLILPEKDKLPSLPELANVLKLSITGEKKWIQLTVDPKKEDPKPAANRLYFSFTIKSSDPSVVPYDPLIHGEHFSTNLPVLRVLIDAGSETGYMVYHLLSRSMITRADINVSVTGVKDLALENDHGRLDASKPFYPFGTQPGTGATFYIGSSEIFGKNWTSLKLKIQWKNLPGDFKNHYVSYIAKFIDEDVNPYEPPETPVDTTPKVTGKEYFKVRVQYIRNSNWYPEPGVELGLFRPELTIAPDTAEPEAEVTSDIPEILLRKGEDVYKTVLRRYLKIDPSTDKKTVSATLQRFETADFNPGFHIPGLLTPHFQIGTRSDYLKLSLLQSFLHEYYARLFSMASVAVAHSKTNIVFPIEPYTPQISSLTIDYDASAGNDFDIPDQTPEEKLNNYTGRNIQLFHEHPFGQYEQHIFLKEQCDFLDTDEKKHIRMAPFFSPEGELYIGVSGATPSSVIPILLQVNEGSEDPLSPTFEKGEKIAWYALSNNEWKSLNKSYILQDTTNNLLRPGIIHFQLPPGSNNSNTRFAEPLFWLKGQLPKGLLHTSVCKVVALYTQAVESVFHDEKNDLAHLNKALPGGTITKMEDKPGNIKKLEQPFASFGGVPAEDEKSFDLRVSERLRHKQRSVNIWDYERIVLRQFPSVYKVKCLNHTAAVDDKGNKTYSELSPGNVCLVIVPDIRNRDSYDPLHPRASQNLLREIEDFVGPLNSLHVKVDAINPRYEIIHLDFRVKFYDKYDPNTYTKILNEDILRYLSPWAFGEFSMIHFGGTLYKSVIIRFIEDRPYVDFISQVKMFHRMDDYDINTDDRMDVTASFAHTILVSARQHNIQIIDKEKVCDE